MFKTIIISLFFIGCSRLPATMNKKNMNETIKQILTDQMPKFRSCYNESLNDKKLEGSILTKFTIDKNGRVKKPRFKSQFDETFNTCIKLVLLRTKFPVFEDGQEVDVRQAINFHLK